MFGGGEFDSGGGFGGGRNDDKAATGVLFSENSSSNGGLVGNSAAWNNESFREARLRRRQHAGRGGGAFNWGRGDEYVFLRPAGKEGPSELKSVSWDECPEEMRALVFEGHKVFVQLRELQAQELANSNKNNDDNNDLSGNVTLDSGTLLSASAKLRGCFDRSWKSLEARALASMDDGEALLKYVDKMKVASAGWQLCEILALRPGDQVSADLVRWVGAHYPRYEDPLRRAEQVLDARNRGSDAPCFWDAVFDCVMHGELLEAWSLLSLDRRFTNASRAREQGGASQREETLFFLFQDVRQLVLKMPRRLKAMENDAESAMAASSETAMSLGLSQDDVELWRSAAIDASLEREFNGAWAAWSENLQRFFNEYEMLVQQLDSDEGGADGGKNLFDLLRMLSGDLEVFQTRRGDFDGWPRLLCLVMLYRSPSQHKQELSALVVQLKEYDAALSGEETGAKDSSSVDAMLLATFQLDFTKAVQMLHNLVGDRWVEAHLVDLLAQAGAVESVSLAAGLNSIKQMELFTLEDFLLGDLQVDLREWFIVNYAIQLGLGGRQTNRNTHFAAAWRVAADYLAAMDRRVSVPQVQHGSTNGANGFVKVPLGLLAMELVIDRQQPKSDAHCLKLTRGCQKMQIPHESIVKERIMYWWCFRGGRAKYISGSTCEDNNDDNAAVALPGSANALLWASRFGEDMHKLLGIVFQFSNLATLDVLVEHLSSKFDTLSAANSNELNRQAVFFLQAYHKLHAGLKRASEFLRLGLERKKDSAAEAGDIQELHKAFILRDQAVQQLCAILAKNVAPKRFYLALLRKVLLWESQTDPIVLKSPPCMLLHQASQLQGCLEDPVANKEQGRLQQLPPLEELSLMRLILVSAMAAAAINAAY